MKLNVRQIREATIVGLVAGLITAGCLWLMVRAQVLSVVANEFARHSNQRGKYAVEGEPRLEKLENRVTALEEFLKEKHGNAK